MYLFLDDERIPSKVTWSLPPDYPNIPDGSWIIARNYNTFVTLIKCFYAEQLKLPTYISFDHDLSDYDAAHFKEQGINYQYKEKTGLDCAKWLIEFCMDNKLKFPKHHTHSLNPIGRDNINGYIESYKSACEEIIINQYDTK